MRMPWPAPAFWMSRHRTFRCETVWTWLYRGLYLLVFFIEGYFEGDFTISNCLVKYKRSVIVAINAMLVIDYCCYSFSPLLREALHVEHLRDAHAFARAAFCLCFR